MNLIQVSNFYQDISDQFALNCKHLKIEPAVYQFKGENGSGKSIFLKYLAKLIPEKHSMIQNNCQRILYLTNEEIALPNLTVRENLQLNHFIFKIREEIRTDLIPEEHLSLLCKNASLGTRQKIGLSLALVENFWDLIVLDEAFSNLDSDALETFLLAIEKRGHEGTIVLFVEHQINFSSYSFFKGLKVIRMMQGEIDEEM
ncbi:ATP-binding cassette domain-containing protein [Atopobacter sp. AH10]|uniref:ABC transporter ATP-binding protein n=1 Tax=Atopobacter sp. AH10 TaxID=2315861 RepID=UPI000EF276B6|nr:ATP-binding cassette domain-containing protein [Atopobacter sp. AH10]RLK63313.1 ATP-binding cassette domain-containing protein [Atopobacter sp. AH10]